MKHIFALLVAALLSTTSISPALAVFSSGSTGVDGAFNPSSNILIDLSLAGGGVGKGVYDPVHWAVVFNYTTINIPAGVTVTFKNHPSGAPVVWLATGDVTNSGSIVLDGGVGVSGSPPSLYSIPGPGGFEGGRMAVDPAVTPATGGFGPGGPPSAPSNTGPGGGYGTAGGMVAGVFGATYGNAAILPLIGGSGGGGGTRGGGAGAGALMIASSGNISLVTGSTITAIGGARAYPGGGASGGGIRLLANTIYGNGIMRANGGTGYAQGGDGRIRIESTTVSLVDPGSPAWTFSNVPGPVFPGASAPTLTASHVGGVAIPTDPLAGIETTDVIIADSTAVPLTIAATNVPVGTAVNVVVVPDNGVAFTVASTPLAGTLASSTASALVTFRKGQHNEVFLRANW